MLIKAMANAAGLRRGEVREVPDAKAQLLIDSGYAIDVSLLEDRDPVLAREVTEAFDLDVVDTPSYGGTPNVVANTVQWPPADSGDGTHH